MKDFIKWTYWIVIVLLIVMAADFNTNWRGSVPAGSMRLANVNLVLGGIFTLLILVPIIKKRL